MQVALQGFVDVSVAVFVRMLQRNGVFYRQYGGCKHDNKSNVELHTGTLSQQYKTSSHYFRIPHGGIRGVI